jgi:hypothetical protein
LTPILTVIVSAVLVGCCILLVAIFGMLIMSIRDSKEENALGFIGYLIFLGFGLLVAAVAYWSASWLFSGDREAASPRPPVTEDYLGTWQSNPPNDIIQTLISNDVRGCGEFHYKPSAQNSGEYLVYCTRDGRTWTAYLVWPDVDRISGPARPDPSISPPR